MYVARHSVTAPVDIAAETQVSSPEASGQLNILLSSSKLLGTMAQKHKQLMKNEN